MSDLNYLIAQGRPAPTWDYMTAQKNALSIKSQQEELAAMPEEKNWLRESRDYERQARVQKLASVPFQNQKDAEDWFKGALQYMNFSNYKEIRNVAIGRIKASGGNPSTITSQTPEGFGNEEEFNAWRDKIQETAQGRLETQKEKGRTEEWTPSGNPTPDDKGMMWQTLTNKKGGVKTVPVTPDEARGMSTISGGITETPLGPPQGQLRGLPKEGKMPPSAGNAVDLAIKRKFGTDYLSDPTKTKEADKWLASGEGRQAVRDAAQDVTPPTFAPMATGTGIDLFQTRGPGAGSIVTPPAKRGAKLPETALSRLSDTKNTIGRLDELEDLVSKPGMERKFGPIEGRWTKLKQKFVEDGPTQEVMTETETLITVAYALSGKQISYNEMQLLKQAILPQMTQPHANFLTTLRTTRKWLKSSYNDLLETHTKSGYSSELTPLGEKKSGGRKDLKSLSDEELLKQLGD